MTAEQLRAARALLRWEQARLATESGVSVETIKRLERLKGPLLTTRVGTADALRRALETAGVIFIAENGDGPGVRLRKAPAAATIARGPATDAVTAMDTAIERHETATKGKPRPPGGKPRGTPKAR